MVGAAAGIQAALPQAAYFACRCGAAAHGDDVLLSCAVDAVCHVPEVELRVIAVSHQTGAGEEVAVYAHGNFPLTNPAAQAAAG